MEQNYSATNSSEGGGEKDTFTYFNYAVTGLCIVSLFLNLHVVVQSLRDVRLRRCRRLNILIANLSIVCGIHVIVGAIFFSNREKVMNEILICTFINFTGSFFPNVISLTVLSISYERMRHLRFRRRKLSLIQLLGMIWIVSFVGSFATIITTSHDSELGKCFQELLFESQSLTIISEILRCLIFHVFVSVYLICEMCFVRTKIKYLEKFKRLQTWNLFKKVQRIKFMYMTSLAFILLWLPFGVAFSIFKSTRRSISDSSSSQPFFVYIVAFLLYLYILILPLTIFYTNESPAARNRFRVRRRSNNNRSFTNGSQNSTFNLSREVPQIPLFLTTSRKLIRTLSLTGPTNENNIVQKATVKKVVSLEEGLDKHGTKPFKL